MVITKNRLLDLLTGKTRKKKRRSILSLAIVLLFLLLFVTSCGMLGIGQPKQGQQGSQTQQQEDKVPKPLTQMEASIEKVFQTLGGPAVKTSEDAKDQQSKNQQGKDQAPKKDQQSSQDQSKEKQQQNGQQQGDQQKQGQSEDKQQSQDQSNQQAEPAQEPDPWQQVSMQITELHTQWNDSLPEITKQGAKGELIDSFSKSLNDLTRITADKDKMKTMLAASGLYSNIPDMYALYKSETNPVLKEIIYYTRDAILNASVGEWDKASADLEKLKSAWGYFKNTLDKEKQDAASKVDLSITELEKVIKDKDPKLTDLKGRLVLSNLEAMGKSDDKNKQQK